MWVPLCVGVFSTCALAYVSLFPLSLYLSLCLYYRYLSPCELVFIICTDIPCADAVRPCWTHTCGTRGTLCLLSVRCVYIYVPRVCVDVCVYVWRERECECAARTTERVSLRETGTGLSSAWGKTGLETDSVAGPRGRGCFSLFHSLRLPSLPLPWIFLRPPCSLAAPLLVTAALPPLFSLPFSRSMRETSEHRRADSLHRPTINTPAGPYFSPRNRDFHDSFVLPATPRRSLFYIYVTATAPFPAPPSHPSPAPPPAAPAATDSPTEHSSLRWIPSA